MNTWTDADLQSLGRTSEIRVAGRRDDGSLRNPVTVWMVVVDGALYVRSGGGTEGPWFKGVTRRFEGTATWGGTTREVRYALAPDADLGVAIDTAYFAKYGGGSPTRAITSPVAKQATLRVEPR